MEVQHLSYQKVNEKWLTIQFDVFDLSSIFFNEMSQTISVINRSGYAIFYTHQTSAACTGVCAHQMEKTGHSS